MCERLGPDVDGLGDETVHLYLAATGPLAGGRVALGVPARDESELPAWSAGSPQSREPKLEYLAGKDMAQRWIDEGVWGVDLAYVGDWEYTSLDGALEQHEENLALLGVLAGDARYWLMACYD